MRNVAVETDTYAAIWADRRPGEETEDAIIRRKFGLKSTSVDTSARSSKIGFRDGRHNVDFNEGFEIFRTYKGKEYRAKATNGRWQLLSTGELYPTLNQLSRAVSGNVENAWTNWYYRDERGSRQLITNKRPPELPLPKVERRI